MTVMHRNVSIIGDGAMGTVLAMLLSEKQGPGPDLGLRRTATG